MIASEVDRLLARAPSGRTVLHYFRDRYALMLLARLAEEGEHIASLRQSRFAPLLSKPPVREALARCGGGRLRRSELDAVWPSEVWAYRLTLGRWPNCEEKWRRSWHQMARRGVNLVLQLNFAFSDQRLIEALADYDELNPGRMHPVAPRPELTLAWARLDIDLTTGEMLIEELQSDWVRDTSVFDARPAAHRNSADLQKLQVHRRYWTEALLAATLLLAFDSLRLRRVFLYDFDTGTRLKGFDKWSWRFPPRSLYTDLPRRFCFEKTAAPPLMFRNSPSRRLRREVTARDARWWVLQRRPK